MRKIKYFDKEYTIDEYVKREICKNNGTQSIAMKYQLEKLCDEYAIEYEKKDTKALLVEKLLSVISYKALAQKFGVGVSSQTYQEVFGISHQDVKRLEKFEAITKVGEYRFRAYGEYRYAALYDVYEFAALSEEDMKELLIKFPKGKRKQPKEDF